MQRFFTPTYGRRGSPFSRQRFVAKCATYGNAFRQRPRALLVICNAVDRPGTLCSRNCSGTLVERFVSPFQAKLLVAGKVEAHRAAVQMVWGAG